MSTRRRGSRALQLRLEDLETRKLLSKTVSGVDADGDTWTLSLIGPGDLRVINQNDSSGNPIPLGTPAEISTITIGGADPASTRLVGKVTKSATGDGKVFFETLNELGGQAEGVTARNGILAIDMPNFWLGHTSTTAPTTGAHAADISIPDGVITLRFGGVDATFTPPGGTPITTNTLFNVGLGLPRTQGTSIIINRSISNGQAASGTNPATQQGVEFHVEGRVNLFQADSIDGNGAVASGHFEGGGGTQVFSSDGRESNAINALFQGQIIGQFGYVRVGNNATNFSVQTNSSISNYYVGGETNNVFVLGVTGTRNVYFGKGMDTVTINSHTLSLLQANRGALNSNVTVDRAVGQVLIGGDVVNTRILSGYDQQLSTEFITQTAPTTTPPAQDGGAFQTILVAGNITDSVFAASVQPESDVFGNNDLLFPHGRIAAKYEGTISNPNETPDMPNQAFYAKSVKLLHGPVIPPNVPQAPFPNPGAPPSGPRVVTGLQPTIPPVRRPFGTTSSTKK
jgi:hypothetical protein